MSDEKLVKDSHGRGKSVLGEKSEASAEIIHVERAKDAHGWEKIILREKDEASAEIYLYGARVASWKKNGEEQLFITNSVPCHFDMLRVFHPSEPVQGGIKLCFPLFNDSVCNCYWVEDPNPEHEKSQYPASIDLILDHCHYQKEQLTFPHRYTFRLRVTLKPNGALELISWIQNLHTKFFWCSFAYNIHLLVSNMDDVFIEGLEFCDYLDHMEVVKKQAMVGQSEAELYSTQMNQDGVVTFEDGQEVNRVFFSSERYLNILDFERQRKYVVVNHPREEECSSALLEFGRERLKFWPMTPQSSLRRKKRWTDKDHKGRLEEHKKEGKISRADGSGGDSSGGTGVLKKGGSGSGRPEKHVTFKL